MYPLYITADVLYGVQGSSFTGEELSVIRCETFGTENCKNGQECYENCEGSPTPYCFASWTNGIYIEIVLVNFLRFQTSIV